MKPTYYRCVWSNQVKVMTFLTLGIILLCFIPAFKDIPGSIIVQAILISVIALLSSCVVYSPKSILVTDDELIIQCIGKTKRIVRADIIYVGEFSFKGSIRTWGSGGFFGYLMWFYNRSVGKYFAYATHEKGLVLIETAQRKYVVSCEGHDLLIAQLKG